MPNLLSVWLYSMFFHVNVFYVRQSRLLKKFLILFSGLVYLLYSSSVFSQKDILNWVGCGISKKSYMTKLAAAYSKRKGVEINLQGGGATRGIREVAKQVADFGGSCRFHLPGSAEEKDTVFEPVAWDALAIITNPENPVGNVTLDQIKKVYTGEITNWRELGGANKPIKLFTRKGKISGVGYSIRAIIFSDINMDFASAKQFKSSGPLEKAVEKDVAAIAITGVSSARLRKVKILSLNSKKPDYNSIKRGKYVLYRPLYITYNLSNPNLPRIKDFIKFAHSRRGRKIMIKNGVVPYLDALKLVMIQSRQSLDAQRKSNNNLTY
ncbi:Phosphate ABC transporter, periplasmic phosphate-binding protein PstS (TC 3.A.1.7.1) [hydrothermal vent metagenome]|uniref:Phosphate ABC transporter, periplasmic phosphate-binding protein PstS (TC 3.A.1.7.1) n=1 Tax=hydrothermal vent metagenome TaxID=652676 RepID=A0A3B0XZG1_9ZZZZ